MARRAICPEVRIVWGRCVVRGAPSRIWVARRGSTARRVRARDRIIGFHPGQLRDRALGQMRHTTTYAEGLSQVFLLTTPVLTFFSFFAAFDVEPAAGRQTTAYAHCMSASGRTDERSADTGLATRAEKRR